MRSLLLPLLLLPSLAAAQTTPATLTLGFGTNANLPLVDSVLTAGPGECGEEVALTWSLSVAVCQQLSLYLVDSATACGTEVPTSAVFRRNVSQTDVNNAPPSGEANSLHAGRVTFTLADVFNAVPPAGSTAVTACGSADPQTRRFRVCGLTQSTDLGFTCNLRVESTPDDLELVYDTEKPEPPDVTVSAQDEALVVRIPEADDIDSRRVQIRLQSEPDTAFRDAGDRVSVGQFEITGLKNGTTYVVRAFQTDLAGNESDPSTPIEATPMEVTDFYERYRAAGGSETGGCDAAGGMGLTAGAALAVLGLWLAASRRRAS